ncbi:MAG: desulfoferrodoxin [Clostridium sp.]|uniref:desulfoferrodoxin n=1 Tax=Clostridium sp. TaxID=1506 RepID=UPI002FCAF26F
MSKKNKLYRCEICNLIAKVEKDGFGKLVCCGKPMVEIVENTVEASVEKHVPVIEKVDGGVRVNVGSVDHPMEDVHFIEWIELHVGEEVYVKYLKPSEKPEAFFKIENADGAVAKAYCNLHGYWKSN